MNRQQRIKLVLTLIWVMLLAAVTVFAVLMIRDLNREIEEIASQPGASGVDFLGAGFGKFMVNIIVFLIYVTATDVYISLRYFLLNPKRKKGWDIVNGISMFLSLFSWLTLALFFLCQSGILLLGLLWAAVCILFRTVYGCIRLKQRFNGSETLE